MPTSFLKALKAAQKGFSKTIGEHKLICIDCFTTSNGVTKASGSFLIELALFAVGLFISVMASNYIVLFTGILYSLYRLATKRKVCPSCSGKLIQRNSPNGIKIEKQSSQTKE